LNYVLERVDFEKGDQSKHLKGEITNNSKLGHEPELRIARLTTWKFIKEKPCRHHIICKLKAAMYLQGCLPSNRCGAPRLDHRYPKPYVKSNLIDLAIDPFSLNELLPHVMMHFRCIKKKKFS